MCIAWSGWRWWWWMWWIGITALHNCWSFHGRIRALLSLKNFGARLWIVFVPFHSLPDNEAKKAIVSARYDSWKNRRRNTPARWSEVCLRWRIWSIGKMKWTGWSEWLQKRRRRELLVWKEWKVEERENVCGTHLFRDDHCGERDNVIPSRRFKS